LAGIKTRRPSLYSIFHLNIRITFGLGLIQTINIKRIFQDPVLGNVRKYLTLDRRRSRISHNMSPEAHQDTPETTEQVKKQIVDLVEMSSFGSSEYQAMSDYIELQTLYESSRYESKWILSPRGEAPKLVKEREARITDFRIALLNQQIYQSESRIPGYGKAYDKIVSLFESHLPNAITREAEIRYPNDKEMQERHARNLDAEVFIDVQNAVFVKQG